ncbi:hypothetical protein BJX65DRAFT_307165 [Aspergillus insuetus]
MIFVENGADIHGRDTKGCTALRHALDGHETDIKTVPFLVEDGANVNASANNSDLSIHLVVRWETAIEQEPQNMYCEFGIPIAMAIPGRYFSSAARTPMHGGFSSIWTEVVPFVQ